MPENTSPAGGGPALSNFLSSLAGEVANLQSVCHGCILRKGARLPDWREAS